MTMPIDRARFYPAGDARLAFAASVVVAGEDHHRASARVARVLRVIIGTAMLSAQPAAAQIFGEVGAGLRLDDNLFRQGRELRERTGLPAADRVYTVEGLAGARLRPADYDAIISLAVGQDLYERNSRLDNIRYTGRLNVTRESGGIVGFRLTGLATRSLTSFSDLRTPIRNIQNIYQADAEVTYPVTPDIRLVATPEFLQNKNSDALVSGNDFRRYGTGIGIGYYNAIGNSIALTLSRRQTDGLKARTLTAGDGSSRRADIDLADTSVDLRLRYSPSPITAVNGVISYLSRNDRSVIGSDYSGPSGYMRFDYRPRDTLTIMGEVGRRLELQSFLVVDAVRADYGNTEVRLGYSDHLFLILTGEIYHRRFRFDPTFTGQVASRNDRNYLGAFAIEYSPRDRVMLRARYAHEFRKSDAAFGGFNSDTVQLSAIVRLGNKD